MKNKKGQIFVIIAVVLLGLMFVSFEILTMIEQRQEVKTRISTMESFLFSIEENLQRQMFIVGFRTIFLAETEIATTGSYASNIDHFFQEAFFNGTVNGVEKEILIGTTYQEIIDSINEKANKVNVEVNFSNTEFEVTQEDPWNVKIVMRSNFIMSDKSNLAKWNKTQEITALVPITGFEDPMYLINTNGQVPNRFNQTPYQTFITNGSTTNLLNHVTNSYYTHSTLAPNFLNRLEGDFSADPNGIESLVYLPELTAQGIQIKDKSVVDYIYFSTANPAAATVSGMPSWFKLDNAHYTLYNVSG